MSWLSSLLTRPGQNAENNLQNEQQAVGANAYNTMQSLLPALGSEAAYSSQEEPLRQSELNTLQYLMSPGSNQARENIYNNQVFGQAAQAANQSNALNNQSGYSPAYSSGNTTAINNVANNAANQYVAKLNDPDYQLNQAEGALQGVNQALQMPQLNNMATLGSLIFKTPQVPVGEGISGLLGNMLGGGISGVLGGLPVGGSIGDFLQGMGGG